MITGGSANDIIYATTSNTTITAHRQQDIVRQL